MFAPNTKSWLVRGGWILNGFGAVTTASLVARWLGHADVADALRWVNVPVAVMTSGYSAFLFAQCKGRDLWLDRWLFAKLVTRAAVFGAIIGAWMQSDGLTLIVFAYGIVVLLLRVFEPRSKATRESMSRDLLLALATLLIPLSLFLGSSVVLVGTLAFVGSQLLDEREWIERGQATLIS